MHGQNRAEYKARQRDETISAGLNQKARQWNALTSELMSWRRTQDPDSASLSNNLRLTEKLLTVNPDPIYLWNLRRESMTQMSTLCAPDYSPIKFMEDEFVLTSSCLKRNPKAYGAWFHRKWCIRHFIIVDVSTYTKIKNTDMNSDECGQMELWNRWTRILDQELDLCSEFLKHDERNFHCWNYRRYIVAITATILAAKSASILDESIIPILHRLLDGSWWWRSLSTNDPLLEVDHTSSIPGAQICPPKEVMVVDTSILVLTDDDETRLIEKEWKFTEEKIHQNFSNGSAFHYRSILLPFLLEIAYRKDLVASMSTLDIVTHQRGMKKLDLIIKELEIVHNAIFTEPDDQTPWWYYKFLVKWAQAFHSTDPRYSDSFETLLLNEEHLLTELIETENYNCKWGNLCLQMLRKLR
jgi:hypothetical protein